MEEADREKFEREYKRRFERHKEIARRKTWFFAAVLVLSVTVSVLTFAGFGPGSELAFFGKLLGYPALVVAGLMYLEALKDEVVLALKGE